LRYIDIKFFVIKERIRIHIVSVDSDSIILTIIDPLIEELPPKVFLEHVAHMRMASHDDTLV